MTLIAVVIYCRNSCGQYRSIAGVRSAEDQEEEGHIPSVILDDAVMNSEASCALLIDANRKAPTLTLDDVYL